MPYRKPSPIQSNHRKTAHALLANVPAFIDRHGINHCGLLTLTFSSEKGERIYPTVAAARFKKLLRSFPSLFTEWQWVLAIGRYYRPHYHVLFSSSSDLRSEIPLSSYSHLLDEFDDPLSMAVNHYATKKDRDRSIRAALSNSPALRSIRESLEPRLKKLGFGHQVDLTPILSSGEKLAWYLRDNYIDAVSRRDWHFKGVRLTDNRHSSIRACYGQFAWVSGKPYRVKLQTIANTLGVLKLEEMKPTFGSKWPFRLGLVIERLVADHGVSPAAWPVPAIVAAADELMPRVDLPELGQQAA